MLKEEPKCRYRDWDPSIVAPGQLFCSTMSPPSLVRSSCQWGCRSKLGEHGRQPGSDKAHVNAVWGNSISGHNGGDLVSFPPIPCARPCHFRPFPNSSPVGNPAYQQYTKLTKKMLILLPTYPEAKTASSLAAHLCPLIAENRS